MKRMPAGRFKDRCLKILDQVAETREPVLETKRGRPVAQVVPCDSAREETASLKGSILEERGDLYATGEVWNADLP